jgi:hypothetical protein
VSTATPTIHHRPSSIGVPGAPWIIGALLVVAMTVAAVIVFVELDDSTTKPVSRTVEQTGAGDSVSDHLNDLPSRFSEERAPAPSVIESDSLYTRFGEQALAEQFESATQSLRAVEASEAAEQDSVSDHLNDLPSRFSEERAPAAPVVESDSLYTRFGEEQDH